MNMLFRPEVLRWLRGIIEQAWDKETAHPGKGGAKGRPEGQCYATSRLLADVYTNGRVVIGSVGNFKNHCWLELSFTDQFKSAHCGTEVKVILDLTADQAGIGKEPIVWGMYEPHPNHVDDPRYPVHPDYKPRREVEDENAARFLGAFDRYLLLKKKVAEIVAKPSSQKEEKND